MHNTIYAKIEKPGIDRLRAEVAAMAKKIQEYVPGYKVTLEPVAEDGRVTTMVEVTGLGDFLPKYSGNLDIITCAAINIAEEYVRKTFSDLQDSNDG
jgi:acetaldehyde dehydrogenase